MARNRKKNNKSDTSKRLVESYEHRDKGRGSNPGVVPEDAKVRGDLMIMTNWGPQNPHPLSRRKTELIWEASMTNRATGGSTSAEIASAATAHRDDRPATRRSQSGGGAVGSYFR